MRTRNLDLNQAGKERKIQLSELEELRLDAYENQRDCKAQTKLYHFKFILCKTLVNAIEFTLFVTLETHAMEVTHQWTVRTQLQRFFHMVR